MNMHVGNNLLLIYVLLGIVALNDMEEMKRRRLIAKRERAAKSGILNQIKERLSKSSTSKEIHR